MSPRDTGFQPEKQNTRPEKSPARPANDAPEAFPEVTQKMLAAFLDLAPDAMIVIDAGGTITRANAQMETLFGYDRNELIGQPLELLLPERFHAAHVLQRTHYMHDARQRPMGIGLNLIGRRKDGSEFPVDISLRPIMIEHTLLVMGAVHSIAVRRITEDECVQIAQRLREQDRLISLAHDAILVRDPAGRILSWNEGAERLYGWRAEEVMGKVTYTLLQTCFPVSLEELEQELAQHGRWEGELVHTCRDGSQVIVESRHVLTSDEQGKPRAILEINRDATERHHLTERLREQSRLINLAHDAILVRDPVGRILSWNEGAERLYGWKAGEVMGKVTHMLLQTRFPVSLEELEQELAEHGRWEGELVHTCRDGSQVIVESQHVLTCDEQGAPRAILEINRDVTERHRLEQVAREARAEMDARLNVLQLILDLLPTGIFLTRGPQMRLLMANQAARNLWGAEWKVGQSREDFVRQGVSFFMEDGRPLPWGDSPVERATRTGEPVLHYQMVIRRPDGTRLPILLDAIPFESIYHLPRLPREMATVLSPSERVVLAVHHDVTALKEAEAFKDQFISLATHELRTPVTVIAGYTDTLLRRAARKEEHQLDEWQVTRMQKVKEATYQLTRLTEDLLDVTRVQSGQFHLDLHPTDLVALTRQVVEHLQTTTTRHQLSLHTELTHLWAMVDAFRIEQVLSNLLNNAIKYSPQGGPVEVALKEEVDLREARFRIRDRGMGIPREQQAYLFGRFMRADNARAAGIRGTGLGLYLCQELIERHGGQICFESEEGVGSTFYFTLPCDGSGPLPENEHGPID